jgi:hypothetical protein
MLKLCYKDYLAGRWLWLTVAVLFILYIIQPMGQTTIIMTLGVLAVYAALSVSMIFEDQGRTETLYASLPLKRRTIVRGRYLLAGLIVVGGAAVVFGSAALTLALLKAPAYEKALLPVLSVDGMTGFLFVSAFLLAVFMPLYYRFGLGKGNVIYVGGLVAFLVIMTGLERLASRTLHLIGPVFTADFLRDPARGLLGLIGSTREALGPTLFICCILGVLTVLVATSLRLSTSFYDKKEL